MLLALLFIGLIGVLIWQLMPKEDTLTSTANAPAANPAPPGGTPGPAPVPGTQPPAEDQAKELADMESMLTSVVEETFDYAANHIARDPMVPLVGYINPETQAQADPAAPLPPPRLSLIRTKRVTGIVFDTNDPMAIVDNEVIYPGYTYPDGVVVDSITEDSVVFRFDESKITVELEER
jgi:hypothetical protein